MGGVYPQGWNVTKEASPRRVAIKSTEERLNVPVWLSPLQGRGSLSGTEHSGCLGRSFFIETIGQFLPYALILGSWITVLRII